jgi:hypothetical protein
VAGGESDGGEDSRNDAAGKFAGARKSGSVRERRGNGGGGVGHREESKPYHRVRRGEAGKPVQREIRIRMAADWERKVSDADD